MLVRKRKDLASHSSFWDYFMCTYSNTMSEKGKCDQQSQYKQKAVIEFLTHEGIRLIQIFQRLKVIFGA